MDILALVFVLLGVTEPVVKTVAQFAPPAQTSDENPIEPSLTPIVIDIQYPTGERCVLTSPTTQIIQRNLTLPYSQQTLYGTAQCLSDK
ncbi:MAG: hypothetical protein K0U68_14265 [Gammaproteobacteria bacterium]|nr:hypothetical protein [Gammaproteobacteria bacterium]